MSKLPTKGIAMSNKIMVPVLVLAIGLAIAWWIIDRQDYEPAGSVSVEPGVFIPSQQRVSDYRVDRAGYSSGIVSKGVPLIGGE